MKHLCTILASVFSFHLFAAPMATVDWVKEYVLKTIGDTTSPSEPQESVKTQPQAFSKTYSSNVRGEDGATYTLTLNLESAKSLALIVTDSTVEGVSKGSVYPYNAQLNSFDLPGAPISVIKERTVYVANVTTNLSGVTLITSNAVTRLSATHDDGTEYWNTTWYGRDYLVSAKGFNGPKIGYVISTQELGVRSQGAGVSTNSFVLSPILCAYADDYADINAQGGSMHYCGNLYFGKIVITRKGREEECVINMSFQFNSGVGSGTVAEYTAQAFEDWYATPKDGIYAEHKKALAAMAGNFAAWGFPDGKTEINDDNANVNLRYSNLYTSDAFIRAFADAEAWIKDEYVRIFMTMYQKLKKHSCPALKNGEKYWELEWGCKCRHTYPDLFSGEEVKCDFAETEQHNFQAYVLEGDNLVLSEDGVGCILCARCMEHREDHGAVHVEVPENADYCGCYCGYYYEKKELEESTEEEGTEVELPGGGIYGGADVIEEIPIEQEEKVEIECTDRDGESVVMDVVVSTIKYVSVTANVNSVIIPWRHVSKTVIGANGKRIKVTTSANSLMEGEVGSVMHHKPQHPMECTCKCGVEHFFKASPCPEICRGCNMARDCFWDTDGGEVWAGHTNGTNLNINVRGYHTSMRDGYWSDESYFTILDDGSKIEHLYSNALGGEGIRSPYQDWYSATTTNGYAACGCACGRFFSDSSGNCGKDERDKDGKIVGPGHHGIFHIYGLRPASEIKDPFTAYCLGGSGEMFESCSCNNREWESENPPASLGLSSLLENGWTGSFNRGKGSQAASLACPDVCRWCWPYGHGLASEKEPRLDINHHAGIMMLDSVVTGSLAQAYSEYHQNSGLGCGCICRALTPETCEPTPGTSSGSEFTFPITWQEIVSPTYHYCDFTESCICDCGKRHIALTPEVWGKYFPGIEKSDWSRCSREMGVCQKCGYYDQDGNPENLNRADPDCHVYTLGCRCDCADDAEAKLFRPKSGGYEHNVRGWSAAQDGENYPNNTREKSAGYKFSNDDIFENYHRSNDGHFCTCRNEVGHHLYHKHVAGEVCKDVCKADVGGVQCSHTPDYYKYNAASKTYTEAIGEHYRSDDADYCGCDCGGEVKKLVDGKLVYGHECADGECYCYGRYASASPFVHGDAVLIKHINLQPTGNVTTNAEGCARCDKTIYEIKHEYKCDNGHFEYATTESRECFHDEQRCQRQCDCCDSGSNCDCPYCMLVEGAQDHCTCPNRNTDKSKFKITNPILTAPDFAELFAAIDRDEVVEIDGDDPVYEIGLAALAGKCCNMPMLETVKFNFATNVGESAFEGAFKNCPNLKSVEFARLRIIGIGAFQYAFQECPSLKALHLPKVERIDYLSFKNCGIQEISCPSAGIIIFEAFVDSNLTTADFAAAVTVEDRAFLNCKSLSRINLPSVSCLGPECFAGCTALKTIVLPQYNFLGSMVQTRMFAGSSLTDIYLPAMSINDWNARDEIVFDKTGETSVDFGIPSGCRLHFSDGTATVQ